MKAKTYIRPSKQSKCYDFCHRGEFRTGSQGETTSTLAENCPSVIIPRRKLEPRLSLEHIRWLGKEGGEFEPLPALLHCLTPFPPPLSRHQSPNVICLHIVPSVNKHKTLFASKLISLAAFVWFPRFLQLNIPTFFKW